MGKAQIRANVKWFSERQRPGKGAKRGRRSPMQLLTLRLTDLARLYRHRYGITLPNDDAGREDPDIALNHLACLPQPQHGINFWIEIWTPWLTVGEKARILPPVLMNPRRWKADALAHELGLKMEERTMLGITTIGATDMNKAERAKRRRQIEAARKRLIRARNGAKPRKLYEAESISRAKPWMLEGISRATWYRKRATGMVNETPHETTPVTP